ncbi:MAG: protein kinase [Rickettsiales bacterium]|jgi:serine/threonine protein kinase|nr:protein kinase [Rickettsiales bacterium]
MPRKKNKNRKRNAARKRYPARKAVVKSLREAVANLKMFPGETKGAKGGENKIGGHKIIKLGEGGYGIAYKVFSRSLGKFVVLKQPLNGSDSTKPGEILYYRKYWAENLGSSALVEPYYADDRVVVLEYCEGGDLEAMNSGRKRETIERNFLALMKALVRLHSLGIAHRDIKPANMLLTDGRVKLADFGLCGQIQKDGLSTNCYGTPDYLSPELTLQGAYINRDIDKLPENFATSPELDDTWAIGIAFFELVTGKHPSKLFPSASGMDLEPLPLAIRIIREPDWWNGLISGELERLEPPAGELEKYALMAMLNPLRMEAVPIREVLARFEEISSKYPEEYERLNEVKTGDEKITRKEPIPPLLKLRSAVYGMLEMVNSMFRPRAPRAGTDCRSVLADPGLLEEIAQEIDEGTSATVTGGKAELMGK